MQPGKSVCEKKEKWSKRLEISSWSHTVPFPYILTSTLPFQGLSEIINKDAKWEGTCPHIQDDILLSFLFLVIFYFLWGWTYIILWIIELLHITSTYHYASFDCFPTKIINEDDHLQTMLCIGKKLTFWKDQLSHKLYLFWKKGNVFKGGTFCFLKTIPITENIGFIAVAIIIADPWGYLIPRGRKYHKSFLFLHIHVTLPPIRSQICDICCLHMCNSNVKVVLPLQCLRKINTLQYWR